ncbi:MAG: hypothetical protein KAQ96_02375, partial [Thermoplasmata archaeon]|nr:hypothetical protein [Thermoplasmata archaeon]
MRVPWVPLGSLAVLLLLCLPATGALGEGGVDPRVPDDVYSSERFHPVVGFQNVSLPVGSSGILPINVSYMGELPNEVQVFEATVQFEIYRRGLYGEEVDLSEPIPRFQYIDEVTNATINSTRYVTVITLPASPSLRPINPKVVVPEASITGFYRVRIFMEWTSNNARSMGCFTHEKWIENLDRVRDEDPPDGANYLISEAGFTVVPKYFNTVSLPNMV